MDGSHHRTMPCRPEYRRCFAALPRVLAGVLLSIGSALGVGLGTAGEPGLEFTNVEAYSLVEVLALQRDNQATNRPLVNDANNGSTLLSVQDLNASTAMGARVFVGRRVDDSWGREAGYLGVYGMTAAPGADRVELRVHRRRWRQPGVGDHHHAANGRNPAVQERQRRLG
jgi:hypothetical protein